MIDPQLTDYINKAHQAGLNDEQIKAELLKAGWQEAQVSDAFSPAPQTLTQMERPSRLLIIAVIAGAILLIGAGSVVAMRYFSQSPQDKNVSEPGTQELVPISQNVNAPEISNQVNTNVSEDTRLTTGTNQAQPINTPVAESNTKTYYNPVYKYSISYPQDYYLGDSNNSASDPYGPLPEGYIAILKRPYDANEVINIYISKGFKSENYTSFEAYIAAIGLDYEKGKYGKTYTINEILIGKDNNIKATEFYSEGPVNLYETYFNRDNNYLHATIAIIPKQNQKNIEKVYRDILNSLSFN